MTELFAAKVLTAEVWVFIIVGGLMYGAFNAFPGSDS